MPCLWRRSGAKLMNSADTPDREKLPCERYPLHKRSQSAKDVPMSRPRPNVIPATSNPKRSWRKPQYTAPRPVSSEMLAPIPNGAIAANATLTATP
jgi:hypothetical protein